MKNINRVLLLLLSVVLFSGCSKSGDPDPDTPAAVSGKISYKVDGKAVTYDGTGYVLAADYSFVKWENTKEQLSIDFYGMASGSYTITTDNLKTKGKARIFYYPDSSTGNITAWVAKTGTFVVTSYSSTGGFKASGTFSATLEKSVNGTFTGEKMEITNGVFTDIVLKDAR